MILTDELFDQIINKIEKTFVEHLDLSVYENGITEKQLNRLFLCLTRDSNIKTLLLPKSVGKISQEATITNFCLLLRRNSSLTIIDLSQIQFENSIIESDKDTIYSALTFNKTLTKLSLSKEFPLEFLTKISAIYNAPNRRLRNLKINDNPYALYSSSPRTSRPSSPLGSPNNPEQKNDAVNNTTVPGINGQSNTSI